MKKVSAPAVKTPGGKVTAGKAGDHHKDIGAGKRGFVLSDGQFVGRGKAAQVAEKAGQAHVKKLHSSQLKGRK